MIRIVHAECRDGVELITLKLTKTMRVVSLSGERAKSNKFCRSLVRERRCVLCKYRDCDVIREDIDKFGRLSYPHVSRAFAFYLTFFINDRVILS